MSAQEPDLQPAPAMTLFKNAKAFETWLKKHHARSDGLWLQIAKRGAREPSVTYAEAVEIALCWGWIDGQKKGLDAQPPAKAFFATLNASNRYAVLWRIQTAVKPETRARRIAQLVDMLARGETVHIFKPKA